MPEQQTEQQTETQVADQPLVTERMVSEFRKVASAVAMEAAQEYSPTFVNPREAAWEHPNANPIYTRPYLYSNPADRQDGRYLPVYDTEADLRILRAMTRMLAETVPAAATVMERLSDYTVASGYDYQIVPSDGERKNALSERANRIWNRFGEENAWFAGGEREAFRISHEEGEWLAWPEAVGGGIELCDATTDEITEPANKRELEEWIAQEHQLSVPSAGWNFGVHRRSRGRRILGFHVVRDAVGADWDYVPSDKACWLKRYTPSRASRGVSAFYLPHQHLQRGDKVFRNTADGTAIQAAIAYIVEHAAGVTGKQVESLTSSQALVGNLAKSYVQTKGGGRAPENVAGMAPGSVPHIGNGQKVHAGPLGTMQSTIYLDVMQTALRMSGALWAMTEGMITGDWSNGAYASMLAAESPFMKGREADQAITAQQFQRLPWLVFKIAYQQGQFQGVAGSWEQIERGLEVTAQAPNVAARDLDKDTQRYKTLHDEKVISRRGWQTKEGFDPEVEDDQIRSEGGFKPQSKATGELPEWGRPTERSSALENCGIDDGGFKPGNKCGGGGSSSWQGESINANPQMVEPVHDVTDQDKLEKIAKSMEEGGWQGRPVLAIETPDGHSGLTGSHRVAAARMVQESDPDFEIPVLEISADQLELEVDGETLSDALSFATDDDDRLSVLNDFSEEHPDLKPAADLVAAEINANENEDDEDTPSPDSGSATESNQSALECRRLSKVMNRKAGLEAASRIYP